MQSTAVPYLGGLAVLAGAARTGAVDATGARHPARARRGTRPGRRCGRAATAGSGWRARWRSGCWSRWSRAFPAPWRCWPSRRPCSLINAVNLLDGLDGLASGHRARVCGRLRVRRRGRLPGAGGDARCGARRASWCGTGRPPASTSATPAATSSAPRWRSSSPRHSATSSSASSAAAAALLVGVPVGDTAIAIVRRWRAQASVVHRRPRPRVRPTRRPPVDAGPGDARVRRRPSGYWRCSPSRFRTRPTASPSRCAHRHRARRCRVGIADVHVTCVVDELADRRRVRTNSGT